MRDELRKLLENIIIYDGGIKKVRIGNNFDGGYVAYDEICRNTENVISVGVEDNVSFDLDFVEKYPEANIHLFDHSVDELPEYHNNFSFYKTGLASTKYECFDTLKNIAKNFNNKTLLKMDIEWNEWDIFNNVDHSTLKKFNQILMEIHLVHVDTKENFFLSKEKLTPYFESFYLDCYKKVNNILFGYYGEVLSKLQKYFYIFHIHANNSLKKINYNSQSFPPLLELSLVRKDLINNVKISEENFPVQNLDFPNKPYKDEIVDFYPLIKSNLK